MESRNYPAALLPVAEVCSGALDVQVLQVPPASVSEQWREAFTLGGMAPTAFSVEAYRNAKARLPSMYAVDVETALEDYQADVRAGLIPGVHRFAVEVNGDLEGRVPAVGRERIFHRVDCTWHVAPGEAAAGRTVVLQHELARDGMRDVLDLDLMFAAIALSAETGARFVQLGRCFHSPGKPPVYRWSRTLGEEDMGIYWERIARIFRRRRELALTDVCERCPVRRRCPQWMLPAVYGSSTPAAYRLISGQDPAAANDIVSIRRYVKALREAVEVGEGQLRTLVREVGP